jgi:hypothetical protein
MRDHVNLMPIASPGASASKCKFELRQRAHSDRIHILGVKPRILEQSLVVMPRRLHGGASALFERERIFVFAVQRPPIDHWFVKRTRRRVVVDDVDTVPARAGQKFFCGHRQLGSQHLPSEFDGWVLRDDGKSARIGETMTCPSNVSHPSLR